MNLRNATIIYALGKYSKVILQMLVTIILARILTPYDYGIIAIITVFSTFFSAFSDMGFGVAIVQKRWLTKNQIDDIFSFTVYFSIVVSLLFGASSFLIAKFYNNSVFIPLGWLLTISLFFNSLNMVPNGLMNKQQLFVKIATRTVIAYLASAIVAIILAFYNYRYYAIVIQSIVSAFITFIWNFSNSKLSFKLKFDFESVKKVSSYSGYQFAFNIVNYVAENLDNLLTGKFFGSKQLGFYNKAYSLTLYPVDNLVGVITPVLHPVLAVYQKNKKIIYNKYIKVFKILSIIGIFLSLYCFFASKELIILFYGDQWKQAIPCFHVLSIIMFTRILNSSCGAIFQVLNSTKLLFYNGLLNTVITVVAILIGVFLGADIYRLSLCVAVSYFIQFITAFYMLIKMGFGFSIIKFLQDIYIYLFIFLIMLIAINFYSFNVNSYLVSAVLKFIYVAVILIILLLITGQKNIILAILRRK